jgi:inorganic pyrophosphatase/exopolyphosphatase
MGKEACEGAMSNIINYVNNSPDLLIYDIVVTVFIDIMRNSTRIYISGPRKELGLRAFNVQDGEDTAIIPSIISRKKQILPLLMAEIEREQL